MEKNLPGPEPYILTFEQTGDPASGFLTTTQKASNLPFKVQRVFWVTDTPTDVKRGHHANKITEEIMVAVSGVVTVETETLDGRKQNFTLNDRTTGLYIPTYCWLSISFEPGAVLLCLASTDFDQADYILDLTDFRSCRRL